MDLKKQKKLASRTLGVGEGRIKMNPGKIETIKEVITRADLRSIIGTAIIVKKKKGTSRVRARKLHEKRKKGRRRGPGRKKGGKYSRKSRKDIWMSKVRVQRKFLKNLKKKEKIDTRTYRKLYNMIKGGFFRSKSHLKLYIKKMESK